MYNHTYYALFSVSCLLTISIILSQSPISLALEISCLFLFLSALNLPSASGYSLAQTCNNNLNHIVEQSGPQFPYCAPSHTVRPLGMDVMSWISVCWFLQLNSLGSVGWCLRYLRRSWGDYVLMWDWDTKMVSRPPRLAGSCCRTLTRLWAQVFNSHNMGFGDWGMGSEGD